MKKTTPEYCPNCGAASSAHPSCYQCGSIWKVLQQELIMSTVCISRSRPAPVCNEHAGETTAEEFVIDRAENPAPSIRETIADCTPGDEELYRYSLPASTKDGMLLLCEALRNEHGNDQRRIANVGLELIHVLLRKNADYGASVFHPPVLAPRLDSPTAILVRMSDKIKRFETLIGSPKDARIDESLEDTLRDLAGYAILWLVARGDSDGC